MARKSTPNGSVPPPSSPELSTRPLGPLSILADKEKLKQREEDVAKINNMNASDLKNACDDALKRVRSLPSQRLSSPFPQKGVADTYLPTVPLPPRTISAKSHSYGCEACVRLVVRLCRFRTRVVWLED